MYNQKVIAFLVAFIFLMAAFTGSVSAINCNVNLGGDILAVTDESSINYPIIEINNDSTYINVSMLKNETNITNKRSKEPKDYNFKKQKQGLENLKTLSAGGIPPKGLNEIIIYNMPKVMSLINTVRTKITSYFPAFYKKLK
jgi:hypothetical protein